MNAVHFSIFFLTMLVLNACTSIQIQDKAEVVAPVHEANRYTLTNWRLNGRIAIRYQNDAETGDLRWQQSGDRYDLVITGPAGIGGIRLEGGYGYAKLNHNGEHFTGGSPEDLLAKTYGWVLPVSSLLYWIKGLPEPFSDYDLDEDEKGDPKLLKQFGWTVEYSDFMTEGPYRLPSKLVLRYPDLQIVLRIHSWGQL